MNAELRRKLDNVTKNIAAHDDDESRRNEPRAILVLADIVREQAERIDYLEQRLADLAKAQKEWSAFK